MRAPAVLKAALVLSLVGWSHCSRMTTENDYKLRGSYFGSFERQDKGPGQGAEEGFTLPKLNPGGGAGDNGGGSGRTGTALMCLCSSRALPKEDDSLSFRVDGALAFLVNDKIGQKYPLDGNIRCTLAPSGNGKVQGASNSLCHYVSATGESPYEIGLTLDLAKSIAEQEKKTSHIAFFNISSDAEGEHYLGHIGSKLPALDSLCDDIVCRESQRKGTPTANYDLVVNERPKEDQEEIQEEEEKDEAPAEAPEAVKKEEVVQEEEEEALLPAPRPSPSDVFYPAGVDGSSAKNAVGKLRCGGKAAPGTPDCGEQGFCLDEVTGAACYWDCQPGFCSCTAGTCFDADGRCNVRATYPESNSYQATCSINSVNSKAGEGEGEGSGIAGNPSPAPAISDSAPEDPDPGSERIVFDAGRDGASPPNFVKSLRCGGEKGKPRCGNMGFCLDEVSGERCFWDCNPGYCSCNSGACFDATGRCTLSATYPESNDWQATCSIEHVGTSPVSKGSAYTAGRDGARPPNAAGKLRCGGTKGKPDCGEQGFCMGEDTGDACYWDCQPGFCSCTSGSCFDSDGRCNLQASYPETNNWQATCPYY